MRSFLTPAQVFGGCQHPRTRCIETRQPALTFQSVGNAAGMRKDVLPLNVPDPLPPPQKSLPVGVAEARQFIGGSCACTGIVDDARNEPVCRIGVIGQNVAPYRTPIRRRRFVACGGPG